MCLLKERGATPPSQAASPPSQSAGWVRDCSLPALLVPVAQQGCCPSADVSCSRASRLLPPPNPLQVCLLDLDYNLPVQVRDSALGKEVEDLPQSDANKEYALTRLAQDGELDAAYGQQRANDTILRLQRTTPYYKVRLQLRHGRGRRRQASCS